jgi:hypothetical protein
MLCWRLGAKARRVQATTAILAERLPCSPGWVPFMRYGAPIDTRDEYKRSNGNLLLRAASN